MRSSWIVLVLGLVLTVSGLTLLAYFTFAFDTWVRHDAGAPRHIEVAADSGELVLHQSEELLARARDGSRAGLRLAVGGILLSILGSGGRLALRRNRTR